MPATDLTLLTDTVQAAGDIALRYSGPRTKSWDKPDGAGPVTEADLAVNDYLHGALHSARPNYGWLSEESDDTSDRLDRETVLIIDPIDGTRSFMQGADTWAISLAIATRGQITAAAVYLPMKTKLYAAALGVGATLNDHTIRAGTRRDLTGATMLAAKPIYDPQHWRKLPDTERVYRPSLAYRLCLVAEGRFDAMLTLRPSWEWDIAAGDLILREAGAAISDRTGAGLRYNNPTPLLNGVTAANPKLHAQIIDSLA